MLDQRSSVARRHAWLIGNRPPQYRAEWQNSGAKSWRGFTFPANFCQLHHRDARPLSMALVSSNKINHRLISKVKRKASLSRVMAALEISDIWHIEIMSLCRSRDRDGVASLMTALRACVNRRNNTVPTAQRNMSRTGKAGRQHEIYCGRANDQYGDLFWPHLRRIGSRRRPMHGRP